MRIAMSVIWLVFVVLFLLLGGYYHSQSVEDISHLEVSSRPLQDEDSPVQVDISFAGSGIDEPLQEFVRGFNEQIDARNRAASKANTLTAYGYYLASLAALVSVLIEWRTPLSNFFKRT